MAKDKMTKSVGKSRPKEGARKSFSKFSKQKKSSGDTTKKSSGPRLPNALRRTVENLNSQHYSDSDEDFIGSENGNNLYEFEELFAEEESKKNHRFDTVKDVQGGVEELPENFKDEDISSDDPDNEDDGDDDDGRHGRLLESVIGMPVEALKGKKRKTNVVVSEAYPESEYNPTSDVISGSGKITLESLVEPLKDNNLKRSLRLDKKILPVQAPQPKTEQEKVERKAASAVLKRNISEWEGIIKRNREAPTIYFEDKVDLGYSSIGAIAAEFKPRSDMEKNIASLMHSEDLMEAYKNDGARLLELNEISMEEVKERQNRLAKLRSILFRHEVKAKRVKKIKSKAYHHLMKKEKTKKVTADLQSDPEAAKEFALMQEYKRAEERMTLRHKNNKWSRHVKEHNLDLRDERTKAAMSEQYRRHQALTRRMNSMNEASSCDDTDDDVDDLSDEDDEYKFKVRAREKIEKLTEAEDQMPQSGLLNLPFMVRSLEKKKAAAHEEIQRAVEELMQEGDEKGSMNLQESSSGRRAFGGGHKQIKESNQNRKEADERYNSDNEDQLDTIEQDNQLIEGETPEDVNIDLSILRKDLNDTHDSSFKCTDASGSNVAYEVSICGTSSSKKMRTGETGVSSTEDKTHNFIKVLDPAEADEDSGTDSEGEMIDGTLSSGAKQSYELPSQEELIQRAFAGDDVEIDFEEAKQEVLNEENPEPEKPKLIPGWGQWTDLQKKRGMPAWMLREHETAKKKKEQDLKKRKDANLKHVIISEKVDKKEEKLHAQTLPYPFTSKEVHEQSIRMPLGPEFNPATAQGALNRPEVVKKPGVIIKPIQFEDVDPYGRDGEEQRQGKQKRKKIKNKSTNTTRVKVARVART